jgi:hypothetical protein
VVTKRGDAVLQFYPGKNLGALGDGGAIANDNGLAKVVSSPEIMVQM